MKKNTNIASENIASPPPPHNNDVSVVSTEIKNTLSFIKPIDSSVSLMRAKLKEYTANYEKATFSKVVDAIFCMKIEEPVTTFFKETDIQVFNSFLHPNVPESVYFGDVVSSNDKSVRVFLHFYAVLVMEKW